MNYIKIALVAVFILYYGQSLAQQDPYYTLYRYNMNLINPAFAGADGTELGVNLRSQWSNVDGGPETQSAYFGTKLRQNVGLGASIVNDKTFVEQQLFLAVDFSYKLKVSAGTQLYLGLKAGADSYSVNTAGLRTFGIGNDPSLSDIDGRFSPNFGAGVYLKNEAYFVSLSVPKILNQDRLDNENGLATLGASEPHYYLAAGYTLHFSDRFAFKPSTRLLYLDAAPVSVDLTAAFAYNERLELGANYRLNEGFGGYFLLNVQDWLHLGYAYEVAQETLVRGISNGTHEVFIRLRTP